MTSNFYSELLNASSCESLEFCNSNQDLNNEKLIGQELHLCMEKCKILAGKLNKKSENLNNFQKMLIEKEDRILNLTNNLEAFINCKMKSNLDKASHEAGAIHAKLKANYDNLNRDYQRVLKSFTTLKTENANLKGKIANFQTHEEELKNEINRLKLRISSQSVNKKVSVIIEHRDISTQTQQQGMSLRSFQIENNQNVSVCDELTVSHLSVITGIWTRLFQKSFTAYFTDNCLPPSECLIEICMNIIPVAITGLKCCSMLDNKNSSNVLISATKFNSAMQYMKLIHWSFIYIDIRRVALKKSTIPTLNRLAEDLITILRTISCTDMGKWAFLKNNINGKILLSLVALRTASLSNDFIWVIHFIMEISQSNVEIFTGYLSNVIFVPLLCRSSATFNFHGSVTAKIVHFIQQSLDLKSEISLDYGQIVGNLTGLQQIIQLALQMPIISSESNPKTYHIFVVLLDFLCSCQNSDKDVVIDIIERILVNKSARRLFKEIGIVSSITHLISKYNDNSNLQISPRSIVKLKSIASHLN